MLKRMLFNQTKEDRMQIFEEILFFKATYSTKTNKSFIFCQLDSYRSFGYFFRMLAVSSVSDSPAPHHHPHLIFEINVTAQLYCTGFLWKSNPEFPWKTSQLAQPQCENNYNPRQNNTTKKTKKKPFCVKQELWCYCS